MITPEFFSDFGKEATQLYFILSYIATINSKAMRSTGHPLVDQHSFLFENCRFLSSGSRIIQTRIHEITPNVTSIRAANKIEIKFNLSLSLGETNNTVNFSTK